MRNFKVRTSKLEKKINREISSILGRQTSAIRCRKEKLEL